MAESDTRLAERLAGEAGALLMGLRASHPVDDAALGAEGDAVANTFLMRELRRHRLEDTVLCEEEKSSHYRKDARRVWIVDPLDGTREFGEGRDDWAVHVALAIDGVAAVGAVALPAQDIILSSGSPPTLGAANAPLRMVVSRTRPAREAVQVANALGAALLPMGSAGAKAMAVVRGEADIYLHTGGQYEWDNCAPVAVAQAAGLHVSRADGTPLRYNNASPSVPDLLICRAELAPEVLRLIADAA